MTYSSEIECTKGVNYSLSLAVECDDDLIAQGEADVCRVEHEKDCNPLVLVSHIAGCP